MSGALNGVKILGFTHFAQAPFALQLLGDLGADIIKIERPGVGDFNRTFLAGEALNGEGPFFLMMNRNKRSITLDLKNPRAAEIVYRLVRDADVLVSNYRPGVLDKLGFGFEQVKKYNDSIIYAEALGYGSTGPYAGLPGQDLLAQCMSGYTTIVGCDGVPQSGGAYLVDMYAAMLLANGIQAALINKLRGGGAQKVEVNLLSAALHLQSQEFGYYLNTGKLPQRPEGFSGHVWQEAPYGIYRTNDGFISLATNTSDMVETFERIIEVDGLHELMPDKQAMLKNRNAIYKIVAQALLKKDTAYWIEKFREVGFWCAKVNNYEEVMNDPQVQFSGIIQEVEHPTAGTIKVIAAPITFSETPASIRRPPPVLGQHTEEILGEIGYTKEDMQVFQDEGLY